MKFNCFIGVIATVILLTGCASSEVSRSAASRFDNTYSNASSAFNTGDTDLAAGYQNSSQMTQGALIGGATGAVAGGLTPSIGFLPGAAGGVLIGGAVGAYLDSHATLKDKLANRNVTVVVLGDQILIEIPSQSLFNAMTAELSPYAYSTLDMVAQYINRYANMSVKISAYTNAMGPERINRALSQEQAESVMKYLWRRGINTRLLSAAGYGGTHLVDTNTTMDWEHGENYRVEITLEKLPV